MHYRISSANPHTRFIEIELTIENINDDTLELQLPAWRPGRYELGNFAKNIQYFIVTDNNKNALPFYKVSKDKWVVETKKCNTIIVNYNYYANQPDAGGCYTDENLLYINPVHCCLYVVDRLHLPCKLQLNIPSEYKIATGLIKKGNSILQAVDYHQMADCPVMASPQLQHEAYSVKNIEFNIWIYGECKPDWNRIKKDFMAFTKVQLEMMKHFPSRDFHFLILALPYKFYHGVEHTNSTVLALGPGHNLMTAELYNDLIGVASHELFHVWNIKTIRPADMLPYDYTKENYSRLGWVYEGFTTYYGDLFLARSGVIDLKQYLSELNFRLQKHMDNYGRLNHAVSLSSFDTWLDGYAQGIPNRKTSIYDEGSLIALMLDLFIRKNSLWKNSLDNVLQALYTDFAMQNHGYREKDIKALVELYSGVNADNLFTNFINSAVSYDSFLQELLDEVGCYISKRPSTKNYEHQFGFKCIAEGNIVKVNAVAPGSPAALCGMSNDDELICINNIKVENNLDELVRYFGEEELHLEVFTRKKKRMLKLISGKERYYPVCTFELMKDATLQQKNNFLSWCGLNS